MEVPAIIYIPYRRTCLTSLASSVRRSLWQGSVETSLTHLCIICQRLGAEPSPKSCSKSECSTTDAENSPFSSLPPAERSTLPRQLTVDGLCVIRNESNFDYSAPCYSAPCYSAPCYSAPFYSAPCYSVLHVRARSLASAPFRYIFRRLFTFQLA